MIVNEDCIKHLKTIKDKWFKVKKMTEQVREVPISKSIKFGDWS